jgi:hypothetical protein
LDLGSYCHTTQNKREQTTELLKAMQEMMETDRFPSLPHGCQPKGNKGWPSTPERRNVGHDGLPGRENGGLSTKDRDVDLEASSEEIESKAEHEEVRKEEAARKPVRALKKQHRDKNLAIGCCQKPKKRT